MSEQETIYVDGFTSSGLHVRVAGPSQYRATVTIDGNEIEQTARTRLYRDGGSTFWTTEKGVIYKPPAHGPRALRAGHCTFDGQPLHERPA